MIRRADASYFVLLWIEAERGGYWHLHHYGIPAPATTGEFPQGVDLGVEPAEPFVSASRWLVACPNPLCGGAQLATPEVDQFFCVECNNGGNPHYVRVAWPSAEAVTAIEAALDARPDPLSRNWQPDETIGVLLFENHEHGLVDLQHQVVAGDVGYPQAKQIGSGRPAMRALTPAGGPPDD